MTRYEDFYRRSIEQPDEFWAEQARLIDWHVPPQTICDWSRPPFARWFAGGKTNLCHNAVDRHLQSRAPTPSVNCTTTCSAPRLHCKRSVFAKATES
jgi:propionyl-CoA synthetase